MALLDAARRVVVARVVYDGSPEAGRACSVLRIRDLLSSMRRGENRFPGPDDAFVEYLIPLDWAGAHIEDYVLHCQILGVPIQFTQRYRRNFLLESADAVVFIAGSRGEALGRARDRFSALRNVLETAMASGLPRVPIVVVANEQGSPGALAPTAVARWLDIDSAIPVIGANARTGDGMLESFIIAMQLASTRIRSLLRAGAADTPADSDADSDAGPGVS